MIRPVAAAVGLAALMVSNLFPAAPSRGAAPRAAMPSPVALDRLLESVQRPGRDLYALASQMKRHTTTTNAGAVRRSPGDYPLGHVERFYVARASGNGFDLVPAVLRAKTAHAYYYVQQGKRVDLARLERSAQVFERHTYPTTRSIFGPEPPAGVDGDRHISIFSGKVPEGGYFSGEDAFPRAISPYSNERKAIYINLDAEEPGTRGYDEVLAHEFQHMIHFYLHPTDEAWINEGSSALS